MQLRKLERPLTVCKVSSMSDALTGGEFLFVGKTDREISVVCETDHVPSATLEREDGWCGFRIEGRLDFSLIGVLARISKVLADAEIGIFAVSTFDTDYILVKETDFVRAEEALKAAGYSFTNPQNAWYYEPADPEDDEGCGILYITANDDEYIEPSKPVWTTSDGVSVADGVDTTPENFCGADTAPATGGKVTRDILAEIVEKKKLIVEESKARMPLEKLRAELEVGRFRMSKAIVKGDWSLIAECKLQSPAKGRLNETHSVVDMARIYEANGAAMLSVHTDPHFLGSNESFIEVRRAVELPLLRKDFVIDEYQIYEARRLGADAVLLIVRILTAEQLMRFLYVARTLGLDALVEVHDARDLEVALSTDAEFIGINNRNLTTFTTSIEQTIELLPLIPTADRSRVLISESGVNSVDDIKKLRAAGVDGVLVGEGLVRASDIGAQTRAFARATA